MSPLVRRLDPWTRDTVAEAMRRWYREEGRAPTADDWRLKPRAWAPSHSIVTNLFGTWAAAREYAGLPTPERRRREPVLSDRDRETLEAIVEGALSRGASVPALWNEYNREFWRAHQAVRG